MHRESVTCYDAAGPANTTRVKAHLISLRRVDALKADFGWANDQCVTIDDSSHACDICGMSHRAGQNHSENWDRDFHLCPPTGILKVSRHILRSKVTDLRAISNLRHSRCII